MSTRTSEASRVTSADIMRVLDRARGVEALRAEVETLRDADTRLRELRIDPVHERALSNVRAEVLKGLTALRTQRTALLAACGQYSFE